MRGWIWALLGLAACGGREDKRADVIFQPSVEPLVEPVVQLPHVAPPRPATVEVTPERAELERAARALGGRLSEDGVIEPPLQDASPLFGGNTAPTTATRPAADADVVAPPPDAVPAPDAAAVTEDVPPAAVEPAPAAAPIAPATVPWLQQYQAAYAARQVALSDITTQLSNPTLGVYVEDFRTAGEQVGTPHQAWLRGSEVQVVSPALEALLLSQGLALPAPPAFTCDASTYACRAVEDGAQGVYFRFAVVGEPQLVRLVGVLFYDTTARTAAINSRVDAFNRVIDARLRAMD